MGLVYPLLSDIHCLHLVIIFCPRAMFHFQNPSCAGNHKKAEEAWHSKRKKKREQTARMRMSSHVFLWANVRSDFERLRGFCSALVWYGSCRRENLNHQNVERKRENKNKIRFKSKRMFWRRRGNGAGRLLPSIAGTHIVLLSNLICPREGTLHSSVGRISMQELVWKHHPSSVSPGVTALMFGKEKLTRG